MAALDLRNQLPCKNVEISVHGDKLVPGGAHNFHSSNRGQWLRAARLGANDGLVSVVSLMMGVGVLGRDIMAMGIAGFAALVAGSCSVAVGEFLYIYSQLDIEAAQMREDSREESENVELLPNPFQAAMVSALPFVVGAMVPVVAAAVTREYKVRLGVVVAVSSLAFVVFGGVGALLGRTPVGWCCARVLVGGWMAMAITSGLTMLLIGSSH